MPEKKLIIPRKIQGFWELMPQEEILFENMLNSFRKVFETNCFLPLDTPVAEHFDVLTAKSGGEVDKEIYEFTKGDTRMCLRYDLTVPLARFVSMHQNDLDFPFKRYQIGKSYRGERPQKSRFREFYQCDADIVANGELPLYYDSECIAIFAPCYKSVGIDSVVEISNRKILAGFFEQFQNVNTTDLMIAIDKVDKMTSEEFVNMLKGLGLKDSDIKKVMKIVSTKGDIDTVLKKLDGICDNETYKTGISELKEVDKYLKLLGAKDYLFNMSIVRGHNYYTGTVFEAFIKDKRSLGAVGAGGRYDNLCGNFINSSMQGVGMSIGATRLFDIIRSEIKIERCGNTKLGIVTFDTTFDDGVKIMATLRNAGIKADIFEKSKSFKSKMKEANRREIPYIIIVGEDEIKTGKYTLKNMQTSSQETLEINEIIKKLQ